MTIWGKAVAKLQSLQEEANGTTVRACRYQVCLRLFEPIGAPGSVRGYHYLFPILSLDGPRQHVEGGFPRSA